MEEDAMLVTREQYVEMLIDASFQDASEMEAGFMSWCERHVLSWREQGHDETWIRQRIAMAQRTRGLHRALKEKGLTMLEIRYVIDYPEAQDLSSSVHPDSVATFSEEFALFW